MDDESGESMEPMEEVPLGESCCEIYIYTAVTEIYTLLIVL